MNKVIKKYLPKIIGFRLNSLFRINKKKAVQKTYRVFCTPRGGKVLAKHKKFLNEAKSEKINFQHYKIQTYHWQGKGKTVLLVHGWDSNSGRWSRLIELLQKENYNCYAFDAPAQGNSSGRLLNVPLFASCLNLMIKQFNPQILIGHSMGGLSILFNEYKFPTDSLEKIVSLGAPSEVKKILYDLKKILGLNQKIMIDLEQFFIEKFGYTFDEFCGADFAQHISTPSLIIHDAYDKVVPIQEGYDLQNGLQNVSFIKTEGCGHSLNRDDIHQAIIDFINK